MTDLFAMLDRLRRPRLLIQAARSGCADYRRDSHLRRLLGPAPMPRPGTALIRLIEIEDMLDQQRRQGDGGYSLVTHVDVLIAMMGEARLLRTAQSQAQSQAASQAPSQAPSAARPSAPQPVPWDAPRPSGVARPLGRLT